MIIALGCGQSEFPPNHLFRETSKPVAASPLVMDLDGDGKFEIVVGSFDGYIYLLDDSLRDLSGWPRLCNKTSIKDNRGKPQFCESGFYSSLTAWDIDLNGSLELFVASESGKLFGWHIRTHADAPLVVSGFPIDLDGLIRSSPTIVADSLIAIGGFEKMFVFDRHGNSAPGWPQKINGWAKATAAWCGDVLAISALTPGEKSRGYLYVWHLNGEIYPNFPITLRMDSESSPTLADLDNDGRVEIILGDDAGFLHVFTLDGSELPGFPRLAGDRIEASPAVVDFDGNNVLDILVGAADGYLYAWNAVGDVLLGWPVKIGGKIFSSVAIAEIYGDGKLAAVAGSTDRRLYGFHADGLLAPGFPMDCGDKIFSSPWVGDLDGDGQTDIVVGANNGIHRLCNIGKLGARPWPMSRGEAGHNGAIVTAPTFGL
jgi:hypothetical protein